MKFYNKNFEIIYKWNRLYINFKTFWFCIGWFSGEDWGLFELTLFKNTWDGWVFIDFNFLKFSIELGNGYKGIR